MPDQNSYHLRIMGIRQVFVTKVDQALIERGNNKNHNERDPKGKCEN